LSGAAAAGAALGVNAATPATASPPTGRRGVIVRPDDPRYADLVRRGHNARFQAAPDYAVVAQSAGEVVRAVQQAVRAGKRIAVRGGGHCFENFVDHDDVTVLIDLSQLNAIDYDERHRAFSIGAGAVLEQVYRELYYGWGVTVPGGGCLGVGVGGHFSGGGYGPLSRLHGSVVDHLYGVELVVVDRSGRAELVTATREGPHRDLWWAHTGGGGGNFGVVTRYLMRSPGTDGRDPSRALPRPPASLHTGLVLWDWKTLTEAGFVRSLRNFLDFYERNSRPGSPYASLYSPFIVTGRGTGELLLSSQIDGSLPNAKQLLAGFHRAVIAGVDPKPTLIDTGTGPFLKTTFIRSVQEENESARTKLKAGYLRTGYTDGQLRTIHRYLADPRQPESASLLLVPYGGQVNATPPSATATVQRDTIVKAVFAAGWTDPAKDAESVGWVRRMYRDVYAATGGVPVPDEISHGSYINYPDVDLADPEWNTSGVPWHDLYYGANYPRLQRIKAAWDPRNVFRHPLSIR
jgi:hypothetical protein